MTFLGNLLLVVAGLLVLALGRLQLSDVPGGDRGVGYAWALFMGHGALVVVLLGVTATVSMAGRLPDLPVPSGWRTGAALAFVAVSTIAAAGVAVASPSGAPAPWSFDAALRLAPLIVPSLLIWSGALLLNAARSAPLTLGVPRVLSVVALLTCAALLFAAAPTLLLRARALKSIATRNPATLTENEQWILGEIDRHEPSAYFISLLGLTRDGNHPTIRARALARLQSLPDWEQRARDALATPSAGDVFTFLEANDVPDPASFAPPIADGIRQQALQVRERIRSASHSSHLYEGLMIFEVEAVLRTVKKFEPYGTDYAPAMRELRKAFSERTDFTHPNYRAVEAIDRWLAQRR